MESEKCVPPQLDTFHDEDEGNNPFKFNEMLTFACWSRLANTIPPNISSHYET